MAFRGANRREKRSERALAPFARDLMAPTGQGSIVQWTVVGTVAIVLGIFTIGAASLPARWAPLFIFAVLCPFIAMIVGNVRRLLLAIIILDIPLQLDIHLGYRTEAAELGAIGGLGISVTTVCLVVLYALWLAELLTKPMESRWRLSLRTSLPLALYLTFVALSAVVARDVGLSIFKIFLLLQMFLLYLYVAAFVRTRQDVLFLVTMLFTGLVLEALLMIGLRYVGQDFSFAGISSRIDLGTGATAQFYRVAGTIGSPNTAASYLSLLLAPAISLLLTPLGRCYKWLAALTFGLGGVALILTLSRGGWLAFSLSIMAFCFLAWRRGWLSPSIPLVAAAAAMLVALLFHNAILARLFGYDGGAALSRIPLMKLAFRMIMDNLVLGVGANNFSITLRQYLTPELAGAWLYAVHSKYLLVWAETGIGGFVAFIWFLLATIRRGWQCWKSGDRFLSPLALGFTAGIVGHMAHMLVDTFQNRPLVQLLWLIAGLLAAMSLMDDNRASDTTHSLEPKYSHSVKM